MVFSLDEPTLNTAIATFHTVSSDRRRLHRRVEELPAPPPLEVRHPDLNLGDADFTQDLHDDALLFRSLMENEVEVETASAPRARRFIGLVCVSFHLIF